MGVRFHLEGEGAAAEGELGRVGAVETVDAVDARDADLASRRPVAKVQSRVAQLLLVATAFQWNMFSRGRHRYI